MILFSLRPRDTRSAVNAVAVAQHSDPMQNHARLLGSELRREELERRYEVVCLVLAFSGCVNVGVIIWILVQAAKAVVSF
jgi:hypothetical protein